MEYPLPSLSSMAAHPRLGGLWNAVPEVLQEVAWPDCAFWQSKLNAHPSLSQLPQPLRFVPEIKLGQRRKRRLAKAKREAGRPTLRRYESCIIEDYEIPTREGNLHDYFNSLIWLRFPQAKFALHAKAYRSYLDSPPVLTGNLRNDLTDALTRFDEGGLVYFASDDADARAAWELFRETDETAKDAWMRQYPERFEVFGHGLLEVWVQGRRRLTAGIMIVTCAEVMHRDEALASAITKMVEPQEAFGSALLDSLLML